MKFLENCCGRFLAGILTATMLLGCTGSAWAATDTGGEDAAIPVADRLTRIQFVEALYEAEGNPSVTLSAASPFTDVPVNGSAALSWAYESKVVSGYGDGTFRRDDNITREEAGVMLTNYAAKLGAVAPKQGITMTDLLDYADISPWAISGVDFCYNAAVMAPKGTQNEVDLFAPKGAVSITDAQTMISALLALKPAA